MSKCSATFNNNQTTTPLLVVFFFSLTLIYCITNAVSGQILKPTDKILVESLDKNNKGAYGSDNCGHVQIRG